MDYGQPPPSGIHPMAHVPPGRPEGGFRRSAARIPLPEARKVAGGVVAAIGVALLVEAPGVARLFPSDAATAAATAGCLALCGMSLALIDVGGVPPGRLQHRLGQLAAALVLVVASVALLSVVESGDGGPMRLPAEVTASIRGVPVNAAAAIWLAATALLGLASRRGGAARTLLAAILGTLIFCIGAFGLIHPLSGFSTPSDAWSLTDISPPAAVAFIALGAGLVDATWRLAGVRWSIDGRLSAGLAAGVLLILGISMEAYRRTADLLETSTAVAQIQGVRTRLAEVLADLNEAEAGARGFVISSDEAYLKPYAHGSARVAAGLEALRRSVADDPAQVVRTSQLEAVAARDLQLLHLMVRTSRLAGPESVASLQRLLERESGAREEISRQVAEIDRAEVEVLQSRQGQNRAAAAETTLLVPLWATACVVILGLVFVALNRGIAERRRAEAELQKRNLELAEANRAKDRFLARMSHEFRTPLNAILGFAGTLLMKMHGEVTPDQDRALRTIRENGVQLRDMVEQILDVIRLDGGRVTVTPAPIDCGALIGEVAGALRPAAAAKGLDLAVEPPSGPLPLVSDCRLLRRILDELGGNAVKFTDRGRVRLAARRCPQGGGGDVDGSVEFVVEDTGIGMRDEDRARLFAAFSQVEESNVRLASGAGLGLYLSGRLAGLIGARIRVRSEPGEGSTFTLEVPGVPAASGPGSG